MTFLERLTTLFRRKRLKGRVERQKWLGGMTIYRVYLTDDPNEFPFTFLDKDDLPDTILIERAWQLKKMSDEFGLQ